MFLAMFSQSKLIMNCIFVACLIVVAASACPLEKEDIEFQNFKLRHGKTYENQKEETKRFKIFKDKLREIEEHNTLYDQGIRKYKKGVNKFSDLTKEEYTAILTFNISSRPFFNATEHNKIIRTLPESIDWRTTGQVTGIKNQGSCGSCWAFSVTGSTEAAYYRKSGTLVSLSEQQLIDCTSNINDGCDGGQLDATFPWVQQHGLESEESYPYNATDNKCKYPFTNIVTKVDGYNSITPGDEDALLDAVANVGPVSVAMNAYYLDSYAGGIYEEPYCSPQALNHAVLIVGYGYAQEYGDAYWIVKNSWGEDWGESGYFNILRGDNECGIAQDAVYPIIE